MFSTMRNINGYIKLYFLLGQVKWGFILYMDL